MGRLGGMWVLKKALFYSSPVSSTFQIRREVLLLVVPYLASRRVVSYSIGDLAEEHVCVRIGREYRLIQWAVEGWVPMGHPLPPHTSQCSIDR